MFRAGGLHRLLWPNNREESHVPDCYWDIFHHNLYCILMYFTTICIVCFLTIDQYSASHYVEISVKTNLKVVVTSKLVY